MRAPTPARKILAGAKSQSIKWLVALVILVVAGFCAICGAVIYDARRTTWNLATQSATSLAAAIETDILRIVESYDLSLQAVIENLKLPELDRLSPELRQLVLFDRSATAKHLDALAVIDKFGKVRFDSRAAHPAASDRSQRDYFQYHKRHNEAALHISRPFVARSNSEKLIAISRRLSNNDGSFAGVVVGSLRFSYFQELFKKSSLGTRGSMMLSHIDGFVLMRWPNTTHFIGRDLKKSLLFKHLGQARTGSYEAEGKLDGVKRLIVYTRVGDLPLVVSVGQPTAQILHHWRRYAIVLALLLAGLSAVAVTLTIYLLKELRKRARSEANLDHALKHMSQGLSMFDEDLKLVVCNDRYIQMYDMPPSVVKPGCSFRTVLEIRKQAGNFSGDIDAYIATLTGHLAQGDDFQATVTLSQDKTISVVNCALDGGGWVATHDDISERQRAEIELANIKNFLDTTIEHVPIPIAVKEPQSQRFLLVNRAYEALSGIPREQLIGTTVFDHFEPSLASIISALDRDALLRTERIVSSDFPLETKTNGQRIVTTTRVVARDRVGRPQYLLVVIDDVTEREKSEARIAYLAHHDPLTDLANRTLLQQTILTFLANQRRSGLEFAVLLLDLDKFKSVNDTHGHQVGDDLLRRIAARLKTVLRETDVAARLGGDEFAVVMQVGDHGAKEGAMVLASRLIDSISAPYEIDGHTIVIGASIGIALAPQDGANVDTLVKSADLAMYRAKSEGRNGYRLFSASEDGEVMTGRTVKTKPEKATVDDAA